MPMQDTLLANLSTAGQTVDGLCDDDLCLHGPLICCVVRFKFVGCH